MDRLWDDDRDEFWAVVRRIGDPATNPHAKATFAQCVIDLAAGTGDLSPLLAPIVRSRVIDVLALDTLSYVFEHAGAMANTLVVAPWLEACQELAGSANARAVTCGAVLLGGLLGRLDSGAEREQAGACARALLAQAWKVGAPHAVQSAFAATIATTDTNIAASISLLDRVITEPFLAERVALLRTVAWKAKDILTVAGDPGGDFVSRLFKMVGASVGKAERDSDEARSGWLKRAYEAGVDQAGPIPSRVSSELEAIAEALGRGDLVRTFLQACPRLAASTIASVVREFELERPRDHVFTIHGHVVRVQGRPNWPQPVYGFEVTLTNTLCDQLAQQAPNNAVVARMMIDAIAAMEAPIELWQAVVARSAFCLPLLDQISDIFASADAVRLMSQSIASVIAQLGDAFPTALRGELEATLARLGEHGIDSYARELIQRALRGGQVPESLNFSGDSEILAATGPDQAPDGDDTLAPVLREHLRWLGMTDEDIDAAPNQEVRRLAAAARRFAGRIGPDLQGKVPLTEQPAIEKGRAALRALMGPLRASAVHPAEASLAWGVVGRLASALARQNAGDDDVRELLLCALARPPLGDGGKGDLLNRYADEACITCIDGLVALAARGDQRSIEAVMRAARDEEPAMRFHVADRVHELAELPGGAGWTLVERLVRDPHHEVVSATTTSFGPFYKLDHQRGLALDAAVLRSTRRKVAFRGQFNALRHLAWVHLRDGDPIAGAYLMTEISEGTLDEPVGQLMHAFRSWLVIGGEGDRDLTADEHAAVHRTWALFGNIVDRALGGLSVPDRRESVGTAPPPTARLLEEAGDQLYFASGAFDGKPALTKSGRSRYWEHAAPLLHVVGTSGVLRAAHRVLETLAHLIQAPGEATHLDVFALFLKVAASAVKHGYAHEWDAVDTLDRVLRFVSRQHPAALRTVAARATATEIVDALLAAKWKKAYLLARDLDLSNLGPRLSR